MGFYTFFTLFERFLEISSTVTRIEVRVVQISKIRQGNREKTFLLHLPLFPKFPLIPVLSCSLTFGEKLVGLWLSRSRINSIFPFFSV